MKLIHLLVGVTFCLSGFELLNAADKDKIGEKRIFQVEGVRPMSNPPVVVEGDRVDEVMAISGEGEAKRWQVKSIWGKNDEMPSSVTIDAKDRVYRVEVGTMFVVEFKPPVPTDWPELGVGQSTTFETKLGVMGMELPLKYEVKRLDDEAGQFAGCRHIQMIVHGTDPSGQPNQTRYDQWFNAKHGLVKEVVVSNYQSDSSQRTVCSLKEHVVP
jgi:hypothetical protein